MDARADHRGRSRKTGVSAVLIGVIAAAVALMAPAAALGAAPTLSGETFLDFPSSDGAVSSTPQIEGTCNRDGVTTFTIRSEGTAVGPYPGTYSETVTAQIGPQDQAPVPDQGNFQGSFGFTVGPLLRFDARFRIDGVDPATNEPFTVTGRKELTADRPPLPATEYGVTDAGNNGFCATLDGQTPPQPGPYPPNTPPITGFYRAVDASTLEYEVIIRSAAGTYRDAGASRASARNAYAEFSEHPGSNAGRVDQFAELFDSDFTEAQPLTAADCKKGGFAGAMFRNQGDCVSFVRTEGRNEPGRNVPNVP